MKKMTAIPKYDILKALNKEPKSCAQCVHRHFCVIGITMIQIAPSINNMLSSGDMEVETPYQLLTETIADRCNRFDPIK